MTTELIVLEKYDIEAVFSEGGVDPIIEKLKEEANAFTPDIKTAKGRAEIKSFAMKFAKSKTLLDGAGKELAAKYRAKIKPIDAERKKIRECCDELKAKVRQPLTDFEEAEKKRIADINNIINDIQNNTCVVGDDGNFLPSVAIKHNLTLVKSVEITEETFAEFTSEAAVEKDMAIKKLERAIEEAEKREAEQEELEKLRKEAAEREAKEAAEKAQREQEERDARIAKEAEERAKADAQRKAAEEAERVEREKAEALAKVEREKRELEEREERARIAHAKAIADAEQKAKEAAQRERDRIAAEKKAEEEATKKLEANKKHTAKIRKEILAALIAYGVEKENAKKAIGGIVAGQIPHVSIKY